MSYNLIEERWIPVICKSGTKKFISPLEIVDNVDPPIEVRSPRSDFDSAVTQFLIGLVQTVSMPKNVTEWIELMTNYANSTELCNRMLDVKKYFELFGDGIRFQQCIGKKESFVDIYKILMSSPGDNTIKNKVDFYFKNKEGGFSIPCTAMAWITAQVYLKQGGSGHFPSLRGTKPMTTILVGQTLWETITLNLVLKEDFYGDLNSNCFPWIKEDKEEYVVPKDNNPLMCYWATPLNGHLGDVECGKCILTGEEGKIVKNFWRSRGTSYRSWLHPFSPTEINLKDLKNCEMSHRWVQYGNWISLMYETEHIKPAKCMMLAMKYERERIFRNRKNSIRLWISGYEYNQATVAFWIDSKYPIVGSHLDYDFSKSVVEGLIRVTRGFDKKLSTYLRRFKLESNNASNWLWLKSESLFLNTMSSINEGDDLNQLLKKWEKMIRSITLSIYDEQTSILDTDKIGDVVMGRFSLETCKIKR